MEDGNPRGGDRDDLEITSIGALYCGPWDKKYWSASRGKDRYPYPVGYHAVRTHGGNMYRMEIHEGVKGPLFVVTSTDGDSSTGQTPDIAWENFQKKNGPRVKNRNGKRFSSKIYGVELFGFRNPFVQRLLRELLANVYGVTEPDYLSPPVANEALRLDDKMHIQDSLDCSDMLVYSRKHRTARKRCTMNKNCSRINSNAVRAKRIRCQYAPSDSGAGNPEQLNEICSHAEIRIRKFVKENNMPSSRLQTSQLQVSQNHLSYSTNCNTFALSNETCCQASTDCRSDSKNKNGDGGDLEILLGQASAVGGSHFFHARDELLQEMEDPDNSIEKHVIFVKETKFTSRDPHLTCVDNICDADNNVLDISSNGRLRQLELPSEKVVSSSDDATLKQLIKDSLPEAVSSSGSSNPSLNLADQELAKSMMTFLLPRAVPLLEKTCVKGKTRCRSQEVKDDQDKVRSEHLNSNMLQGEFEDGMLLSDTKENFPERLSDPISVSGVNCQYQMKKMEQFDRSIYLDDAKLMIPDSFENDCTVHIKKHSTMAYGIDCTASDITREKMITAKPVIAEAEKVQDSSDSDKVVMMPMEPEKGEYLLTDSLEHCLEEALNDDLFVRKENVSDASCSLGACVDHELQYLNPAFNKHNDFRNLNTGNGENVLEEMVIPEKVPHCSTFGKDKIECLEQCPAVNSNSNLGERGTSMVVIKESSHINEIPNKELQSTSSDKLVESEIHNITDHKDYKLGDQISAVHTFPLGNSESAVNLKGDSASFFHMPNITLSTEGQQPSSFNIGKLLNPSHFSGKCNVLSESIICRNYMDDDATEIYLTPRTSEMAESIKTRISSQSNSRMVSQAHDLDTYANANVKNSKVGDPSTLCAEKTADFMNKLQSSTHLWLPPYQECVKDVHNESRDVLEDLTFSVKNPTMRVTVDEKSNNFFDKQHKLNGQLDGCSFESNKELGGPFELAGCYMHPEPVLSIFLSSKENTLQISVTCGLQESNERYLFIYTISLKDQGGNCPSFIGYTPLLLPLLTGPPIKRTAFDTSGLQFMPDSQSLVFLSSVKVPLCSERNINCSCPTCKSDCHEENAILVGQVKFGYVLPLAKLMTTERVSCILVCEPNYLIAAEASGTLHVWLMNCKWSGAFEEFVLPSFDHLTPAIELKMVSKSDSIIVGHNGTGGFGLWDISRRALLAMFSSPGNLIFQMLPIGIFGFKDETIFSAAQDMECMQGILKSNDWVTEDAANPLPLRQDIAVWILVSAASDLEDQVAYQLKKPNRHPDRLWRLALLLKNMVIMGSVLDSRASSALASADYGIIGTYDGLVYKWELSTGKKLANLISLKSMGSILCTSMESKSGVLAVADDKCRLLIFKQPQGWM
ncbi:hypothetical protein MUK42_29338 [Musa troglodytarum]|uniref:Uncharacterized protein n=1 Tax=Musa troglodytarum TaxID=320322 RepID=A0A9E7JY85_9LILI|nr:hypothetical protein MUK42_29338 [Musa troglodytarum]